MIKNVGIFSLGFILSAFSFWLGGADFNARGTKLEYQFDMCFIIGWACIFLYQANIAYRVADSMLEARKVNDEITN